MENKPDKEPKEEISVYKILKQIKEGVFEAKDLPKEQRQECVEVLTLEGQSVSAIANLLNRSEKTIKRDLEDIWQRNSRKPTAEIALQLIAEMIGKSKSQQAHLMRLARSDEGTVQERTQAEYLAWKIQSETVERLQSLGYLPLAPQKVVGDIYHHQDEDIKTPAELQGELVSLEEMATSNGILDEATKDKIKSLRLKISQAEIAQGITDLTEKKTNEIQHNNEEGQNDKRDEQ
jgi:hypothetical protein